MQCPLYEDNQIRNCEKQFNLLVSDVSYDFCNSEEYEICPFYKILIEKKPYCEYIEECGYHFHRLNSIIHHNVEKYREIMNLIFNYCLSENKCNCDRLKYKKTGKPVPKVLLQDGSILQIREIVAEE